jgi:hypothetical protein
MNQQIIVAGLWMVLAVSSALRAETATGEFQTVDKHKSNTVKVDPGVAWAGYGSIVPAPAVYDPSKPGRRLTAKQEEKVRAAVDTSLREAFPDAANRGGRVLEVRPVAHRRLHRREAERIHPGKRPPYVGDYGGASVRYDLFDAETGAQVGEIASKRWAAPWNMYPWQMLQAFQPVGHASTILKRDSKMLRKDLSKIEGGQGAR